MSNAWTPGPWQPTPDYPEVPYVGGVDAQQYVAGDGVTEGPYVEATGPDRALIALAPEMAEAILCAVVGGGWDGLDRMADKLRQISERARRQHE